MPDFLDGGPPEPFNFYTVTGRAAIEGLQSLNSRTAEICATGDSLLLVSIEHTLDILQFVLEIRHKADELVLFPSLENLESCKAAYKSLVKLVSKREKGVKHFEALKQIFNAPSAAGKGASDTSIGSKSSSKSNGMKRRLSLARDKFRKTKKKGSGGSLISSSTFKSIGKHMNEWVKTEVKCLQGQLDALNSLVPNELDIDNEESTKANFCSFEDRSGIVSLVVKTLSPRDVKALLAFTTRQFIDSPQHIMNLVNAIHISCGDLEFQRTLQTIKQATGDTSGVWKLIERFDVVDEEFDEPEESPSMKEEPVENMSVASQDEEDEAVLDEDILDEILILDQEQSDDEEVDDEEDETTIKKSKKKKSKKAKSKKSSKKSKKDRKSKKVVEDDEETTTTKKSKKDRKSKTVVEDDEEPVTDKVRKSKKSSKKKKDRKSKGKSTSSTPALKTVRRLMPYDSDTASTGIGSIRSSGTGTSRNSRSVSLSDILEYTMPPASTSDPAQGIRRFSIS